MWLVHDTAINVIDLDSPISQEAFGAMVGITQQAVSQAIADGILDRDATAGYWLKSYCDRLRAVASGRASPESLELTKANTDVAREKRDNLAIKNAILLKQYAPVALLTDVLASASQSVATQLDALVPMMQRDGFPLDDAARVWLATKVAEARNEWVRKATDIALLDLLSDDDGSDGVERESDADADTATSTIG